MGISEGIKFYNDKNYSEALNFFLSFFGEKDDDDPFQVAYYLGLCYAQLGKFEDSIGYLEQVVTSDENIARVYQCRLILAYSYAKTGRAKLAEFELSKLTKSGYESVQVYSSLGYVAYEHGDVDRAIECYTKAVDIDPNNATALNGLGYIYADTDRDIRQALVLCKRANDSKPEHAVYMDSLAWVYHKMKFPNEAQSFIKKVKDLLPDSEIVDEHYNEIMES